MPKKSLKKWLFNILWSVLIALGLAFAVRAFVLQNFRATTDAVEPDIPKGSYALVFKLTSNFVPGDIVVYKSNGDDAMARVVEAGPTGTIGVLKVERRGKGPFVILEKDLIGKVILNTRGGQRSDEGTEAVLPEKIAEIPPSTPMPAKLSATKEQVKRIEMLLKTVPVTTGYPAEIFAPVPGTPGEYRLRPELMTIEIMPAEPSKVQFIPLGKALYLPEGKKFFLQWDPIAAGTLHYYGPFDGDPAAKLGLTKMVGEEKSKGTDQRAAEVEAVAKSFMAALRDRDIEKMKGLSLGSVEGWGDDTPSGALKGREGFSELSLRTMIKEIRDGVFARAPQLLTDIQETAVLGDFAAACIPGPDGKDQPHYLRPIFKWTPQSWRFLSMDDERRPLKESLAQYVASSTKTTDKPSNAESHGEDKPSLKPVPPEATALYGSLLKEVEKAAKALEPGDVEGFMNLPRQFEPQHKMLEEMLKGTVAEIPYAELKEKGPVWVKEVNAEKDPQKKREMEREMIDKSLYLESLLRGETPPGKPAPSKKPAEPQGPKLIYEIESGAAPSEMADIISGKSAILMDGVLNIVERRINVGVEKKAVVRRLDDRRLEVTLMKQNEEEKKRVKRLLASAGTMAFRILASERDKDIVELAKKDESKREVLDSTGKLLAFWVPLHDQTKDSITRYPKNAVRTRKEGDREITEILVRKDTHDITGSYIQQASVEKDSLGHPCINFTFNAEGGKLFGKLTSEHLPDEKNPEIRYQLGIILDGKLYSAPNIMSTITDSGQITGHFTEEEAADLADILSAGSLPVRLRLVEQNGK